MAIDTSPVSFTVKVEGDVSCEIFEGIFKVKPVLTQSEQIQRDNIAKELLGGSMKDASGRALSQAILIAEMRVRIVDAPSWWKESNGGMLLVDEVVLATVFDQCADAESKWRKEVKEKADAAKKLLAEMPMTR